MTMPTLSPRTSVGHKLHPRYRQTCRFLLACLWAAVEPSLPIPLVDEPIANRSFETLDELEDVLFHRCQSLLQQQDLIQGLTGFHWWTKIGV